MPNNDVEPYSLPRRVRAIIGEIILVGAEIDHLITLALFSLTNIDFTIGFAIMDRTTIGTKLEKLRYFMRVQKDDLIRNNFKILDEHLKPFIKLRNALAHGVLLGRHADNIVFMLTAEYQEYEGSFSSGACGYTELELRKGLNIGRECVTMIKELFDVKPLHETTDYILRQGKSRDQKSRRRSSPQGPQSPPQSSQE